MNKQQKNRLTICEKATEKGVYLDCSGCVCNVCIGQYESKFDNYSKAIKLLEEAVKYFEKKEIDNAFTRNYIVKAEKVLK